MSYCWYYLGGSFMISFSGYSNAKQIPGIKVTNNSRHRRMEMIGVR